MPPKKANAPSKKTEEKKKAKIVEVSTISNMLINKIQYLPCHSTRNHCNPKCLFIQP